MKPDSGVGFRTALDLDLSSLACPPVFLVMMAYDSQVHVASNSMTVSKWLGYGIMTLYLPVP